MTTPDPTSPKKGPTKLGLGGRAAAPPVAPSPASASAHHEKTPGAGVESLPDDVKAAFSMADGKQPVAPVNVASDVASELAGQQANQGRPNNRAGKRTATASPMTVNLANLMAPQLIPDKDLYNPGWRLPRYFTEAVRVLAFTLRVDQQAVAQELMYSAMMGQPLGGVLESVHPDFLRALMQESYARASGQS